MLIRVRRYPAVYTHGLAYRYIAQLDWRCRRESVAGGLAHLFSINMPALRSALRSAVAMIKAA